MKVAEMKAKEWQLRQAEEADIPACLAVLDYGRASQRAAGFEQWPDGYPSEEDVRNDIAAGMAYVMTDPQGNIAAYIAIAYYDSEYERLREIWTPAERYAVFHRIAVGEAYRHSGQGVRLLALAEAHVCKEGAEAVRIDTGLTNLPMQRLLASRSYRNLGHTLYSWGPRYSYEKLL